MTNELNPAQETLCQLWGTIGLGGPWNEGLDRKSNLRRFLLAVSDSAQSKDKARISELEQDVDRYTFILDRIGRIEIYQDEFKIWLVMLDGNRIGYGDTKREAIDRARKKSNP